MRPRNLPVEHRIDVRTTLATVAFLIAGLSGCASELTPRPIGLSVDTAPYVGVFTGEFVNGRPLYRLPTIEVVGSRTSLGPGS